MLGHMSILDAHKGAIAVTLTETSVQVMCASMARSRTRRGL